MDFYKILEQIMKEKDLKISEVAKKCNLTDSTVRSIITRKNKTVALEVAFKISEGLGIGLEELNGEKPRNSSNNEDDSEFSLTDEEKQIIRMYRTLHPAAKKFIFNSITAQQEPVQQNKEAETEVNRVAGEIDEFLKIHENKPFSAQLGLGVVRTSNK